MGSCGVTVWGRGSWGALGADATQNNGTESATLCKEHMRRVCLLVIPDLFCLVGVGFGAVF